MIITGFCSFAIVAFRFATGWGSHLMSYEALMAAEKAVNIRKEPSTGVIRVKTQLNLKDGDFLIMKNGNPWQKGR